MVGRAFVTSVALILAAGAAATAEAANQEPLIVASLVHQGGGENPWGMELGGALLTSLGDHCGWNEWPDCRDATWWPVVGPRMVLTWRGSERFGYQLTVLAGPSAVEMHHGGFLPIFSLFASAGGALEYGEPPTLLLGGAASKSLSYTKTWDIPGGTSFRTYGLHVLSASFGAHAGWSGGWKPARWTSGLELATYAVDLM